jgi:DNA polymerase V
VPVTASPTVLPLVECPVRAGFASPAEDFSGKRLDLLGIMVEIHIQQQSSVKWALL